MLLQRCHFLILLHTALLLGTTCQNQEPGCSTDGCQGLHGDADFWLLQLSQNISLTNHTVQANLANATKASTAATHRNGTVARDQSASGRLLQALQGSSVLRMQQGASAGLIVLDAMLVIGLAGILACCLVSFMGMGSTARNQQPRASSVLTASRPFAAGSEKSLAISGTQDAVPPPVICPELILLNSEARFRMSMKALLDEDSDYFPILSPSKVVHFEAKLEEGRVLFLYSPGHDIARITLQSPKSVDIQMMNILDGQGRFFGKIDAQPNRGGLLLYHKNKPSVRIKIINIATYSMVAEPILGSGKLATIVCSGDDLRCQVKNGVDPVLFLGVFLALIALKPSLLELGVVDTSPTLS